MLWEGEGKGREGRGGKGKGRGGKECVGKNLFDEVLFVDFYCSFVRD